jgi:N-methylhydantoinase B
MATTEQIVAPDTVDPLTLGVIWRGMVSAANDAGTTLQRTAYSEAVREGRDFSVGLFDHKARMIVQGDFSPGHLGSMPSAVGHVLDTYPIEDLKPGDAIMLNDHWMGSGHLPDFFLCTPVFDGEEIAGFAVCCVHMIDVGGAVPGSQQVAGINDHYQEGIRFLPTRVWSAGEPNREILRTIEANVRVPEKLLGDLKAMRNCNRIAEQRILEVLRRFGRDTYESACDEILVRSEKAMRESITEVPDGTYHAVDHFDDYGPDTDPLRIEVTVTVAGDEITIDFEGSSPQTKSGINGIANYVRAFCLFVVKAITHGSSLPQNAGSIAPIHWKAPPGSVVNAMPPAGAGARAIMQQRFVDALMEAFAPALPDTVIAPSSHWANPIVGGLDPRTGKRFVFYDIIVGGFGGRPGKDGIEAMCPSFNIDGIPSEINEHSYPVLVERYEMIRDSAGAGKWRGGHGIRKDTRLLGEDMRLSNLSDRHHFEPPGILGGKEAPVGGTFLNPETETERKIHSKGSYDLETGDVISSRLSGAGGYGDPLERDPHLVARDVRHGFLSRDRAESAFGVRVDAGGAVDENETATLRAQSRQD